MSDYRATLSQADRDKIVNNIIAIQDAEHQQRTQITIEAAEHEKQLRVQEFQAKIARIQQLLDVDQQGRVERTERKNSDLRRREEEHKAQLESNQKEWEAKFRKEERANAVADRRSSVDILKDEEKKQEIRLRMYEMRLKKEELKAEALKKGLAVAD